MTNKLLQQILELDESITVDTLEITQLGDKKITKIKFKKAEPEVHYRIDDSNHTATLEHLINMKEPASNASVDMCDDSDCDDNPCKYNGTKTSPKTVTDNMHDCKNSKCPNLITEEQLDDSPYCSVSCWQIDTTSNDMCICPRHVIDKGSRMGHCKASIHFNKHNRYRKRKEVK